MAAPSPPALRLHIDRDLRVWSAAGDDVSPKARKARALLALVALSATPTVSRRQAAATLWSNLDSATGLARLRTTLHHLRQHFNQAGTDPLVLTNGAIALGADIGGVDLAKSMAIGMGPAHRAQEFLGDLEGIDPAFDRWLARIRADRHPTDPAHAMPGGVAGGPQGRSSQGRAHALDAGPHLDQGPSILVHQFDADGSASDTHLANALTDAVTGALAGFRWFTTVVRSLSAQSAPPDRDDLSGTADYALAGTLHCTATQCRLSLRLIALNNLGAVVWAASSVLERQPSFADQEKLATAIAARLDSELLIIEAERQQRSPSLRQESAYSLVLRAVPAIYRLDRDPFLGAGHVLEQAVSTDRDSALAHSWLAYWYVFFVGQGWATNRFQAMTNGGRAAERAMMLDPKDARAVAIAGHVKAFLNRRLDQATALHELALQLNPALPLAWHFAGMTHAYAGRLEEAFRCISEALDLSPSAPHGFFAEGALGIVHLLRHDHEAAVAIGRRVTERQPHFTSALKSYLAALGYLGRKAEASEVRKRLAALEPGFSLQRFQATTPHQRPRDIEHFRTGLRLAGVA